MWVGNEILNAPCKGGKATKRLKTTDLELRFLDRLFRYFTRHRSILMFMFKASLIVQGRVMSLSPSITSTCTHAFISKIVLIFFRDIAPFAPFSMWHVGLAMWLCFFLTAIPSFIALELKHVHVKTIKKLDSVLRLLQITIKEKAWKGLRKHFMVMCDRNWLQTLLWLKELLHKHMPIRYTLWLCGFSLSE